MIQDLDLSRRAVAAGWKWQAGAALAELIDGLPARVIGVTEYDGATLLHLSFGLHDVDGYYAELWMLPDFNDLATRGVLLQQVRERWGDPGLYVQGQYSNGIWNWRVWGGKPHGGTFNLATERWHDSESAALVAALEAAPKR